MYIFGEQSLDTLNLRACSIMKNDFELLANCIHNNPIRESKIRVLNLSKNPMMKEGAKLLAPALEGNKTIEILDLS